MKQQLANSAESDQIISDLDLSGLGLRELEYVLSSIEFKSSIKSLNLSNNNLTCLPNLSEFTSLEELNVSDNNFTDLPDLSFFSSLKKIDFSYNPIQDISTIADNMTITHCILNEIAISDETARPLGKNFTITCLELIGNNLTTANFLINHPSLEIAILRHNKITSIDFLIGGKLQVLDVSNNEITDIPCLKNNRTLQTFKITNNKLASVNGLKHNKSVTSVFFNYNPAINDIHTLFTNTSLLSIFMNNLSSEDITKIRAVEERNRNMSDATDLARRINIYNEYCVQLNIEQRLPFGAGRSGLGFYSYPQEKAAGDFSSKDTEFNLSDDGNLTI